MEERKFTLNFGPGPAKLPTEVLVEVQNELLSYANTGMSLMEMSFLSNEYVQINQGAQDLIRELLDVPNNYKILFVQSGGLGAFATIAMNFMNRTGTADYAVTGKWSEIAYREAEKYGKINLVFPIADKYGTIPPENTWKLNLKASYFFYCDNETIDGVEFPYIPETNGVPIVVDMCSNLMTRKFDVSKFACIFGAAQKSIGPAGVVVIIVREDLLGNPMSICPTILNFTAVALHNSLLSTPATFSIYVMDKVLQWIKRNGGVKEMEKLAKQKSELLYDTIMKSNNFYCLPMDENYRSRINVPFRIGSSDGNGILEEEFLQEAEKRHMYFLKGHKLVGGIRVSMYNPIGYNEVGLLVRFMKEFQRQYAN